MKDPVVILHSPRDGPSLGSSKCDAVVDVNSSLFSQHQQRLPHANLLGVDVPTDIAFQAVITHDPR